jgi:hypothetical protein
MMFESMLNNTIPTEQLRRSLMFIDNRNKIPTSSFRSEMFKGPCDLHYAPKEL